jgi:hypothetical protein
MLKKTLIGVVLATIAVSGDASAQGITQQTDGPITSDDRWVSA